MINITIIQSTLEIKIMSVTSQFHYTISSSEKAIEINNKHSIPKNAFVTTKSNQSNQIRVCFLGKNYKISKSSEILLILKPYKLWEFKISTFVSFINTYMDKKPTQTQLTLRKFV